MATYVSKSEFKAKAFELFRRVEASGVPVVITEQGKPKLEMRRCGEPARKIEPKRDPLERLRGSVLHYEDPFEPAAPRADWDALK